MEISEHITLDDKASVQKLLEDSGFFYPFEVEVVMGIMDETIQNGSEGSGYYWLKLEEYGQLLGFSNFGPNPCSVHSWDLYWLAVDRLQKSQGLGSLLLKVTEEKVKLLGGKILWAETSGRPLYDPTVAFYHRKGYEMTATLPEFYGPGDPKIIFSKKL